MAEHRYGIDLILNDDVNGNLDLVLKPSNDLMTTQDYENTKTNVRFDGYYSILRAIMNRLETNPGEYQFDPAYGAGIQSQISLPVDANFTNNISFLVQQALLADDRIREVISVNTQMIANEIVIVNAKVILIGDDGVSELVFPEMFIG